jgi:hypothetical protein
MADSKSKRGKADRARIALNQPHEVRYWCQKLKVTPAKLKAAVKAVGNSSAKVESYIKVQKHKGRDRSLIAVNQAYEVQYWAKKFKVSPAKLKAAVTTVGRSARNVGAYLMGGMGALRMNKTKKKRKAKRK